VVRLLPGGDQAVSRGRSGSEDPVTFGRGWRGGCEFGGFEYKAECSAAQSGWNRKNRLGQEYHFE
jgi:hypothetical protein